MTPSHEPRSNSNKPPLGKNRTNVKQQQVTDPTPSSPSASARRSKREKASSEKIPASPPTTQTTTTTTTVTIPLNSSPSPMPHRLDRFGFIVNMDSVGNLMVWDDDDDDDDDDDASALGGGGWDAPPTSTASAGGAVDPDNSGYSRYTTGKIPTFREYQTTRRREKKWGAMMGRWTVPDPLSKLKKKQQQPKKMTSNATTSNNTTSHYSDNGLELGLSLHNTDNTIDHNNTTPASFSRVHRRKVVTRLRKGVPDHMRGPIWQYLARVPQREKGLYLKLVHQAIRQHEEAAHHSAQERLGHSTYKNNNSTSNTSNNTNTQVPYIVQHAKSFKNIQDTIERDIHRTYPRHHLFYEEAEAELCHHVTSPLDSNTNEEKKTAVSPQRQRKGEEKDESSVSLDELMPPSPSLLQRNSALSRSHSPQEAPHRPVSSLEDEEDEAAQDALGFCGNQEISNMIRELEGVVAGDSPTPPAAPPTHSNSAISSSEGLPARVADAVGGQASLRRVLKAYSVYDREIGYCQGMNFVAGMFLTIMPEEESFWLLVSVMNDPPCRMRGLFGEGMRETHLVLYVGEKLIQHHLPKLFKHLEKEHVHITMFATQWLLTQYTSSFRFDLVLRVWDAFLGEGWKVTYRVMLAILKLHEAAILQSSFEDILALFRELPDRVVGSTVMEAAFKIPLRTQLIRKYESEYHAQQKAAEQQTQEPQALPAAAATKAKKGRPFQKGGSPAKKNGRIRN